MIRFRLNSKKYFVPCMSLLLFFGGFCTLAFSFLDRFGIFCGLCGLLNISPLRPVFLRDEKMAEFVLTDKQGHSLALNFEKAYFALKQKNNQILLVAFRRIQKLPYSVDIHQYSRLMYAVFCINGTTGLELGDLQEVKIKHEPYYKIIKLDCENDQMDKL